MNWIINKPQAITWQLNITPEQVAAAPVISGDDIFFTTDDGQIISLDNPPT